MPTSSSLVVREVEDVEMRSHERRLQYRGKSDIDDAGGQGASDVNPNHQGYIGSSDVGGSARTSLGGAAASDQKQRPLVVRYAWQL